MKKENQLEQKIGMFDKKISTKPEFTGHALKELIPVYGFITACMSGDADRMPLSQKIEFGAIHAAYVCGIAELLFQYSR